MRLQHDIEDLVNQHREGESWRAVDSLLSNRRFKMFGRVQGRFVTSHDYRGEPSPSCTGREMRDIKRGKENVIYERLEYPEIYVPIGSYSCVLGF